MNALSGSSCLWASAGGEFSTLSPCTAMTSRLRFTIAMTVATAGLLATGARASDQAVPRLDCARPSSLRLVRFEDGSAQLRCGPRLLVRVSSPG